MRKLQKTTENKNSEREKNIKREKKLKNERKRRPGEREQGTARENKSKQNTLRKGEKRRKNEKQRKDKACRLKMRSEQQSVRRNLVLHTTSFKTGRVVAFVVKAWFGIICTIILLSETRFNRCQ